MNERDKRRATRKKETIHVVKKAKQSKKKTYETRRNNTRKEVEIEGEKRKKE